MAIARTTRIDQLGERRPYFYDDHSSFFAFPVVVELSQDQRAITISTLDLTQKSVGVILGTAIDDAEIFSARGGYTWFVIQPGV